MKGLILFDLSTLVQIKKEQHWSNAQCSCFRSCFIADIEEVFRDRIQISLPILTKFKRIYLLLFPRKPSDIFR